MKSMGLTKAALIGNMKSTETITKMTMSLTNDVTTVVPRVLLTVFYLFLSVFCLF